jgi:DNA polymerase-3 subunit delta'
MPNISIGHTKQFELLRSAVLSKRAAHAYLFWGEPGIGKNAFAFRVAESFLCEREEFGSCGECSSCIKMQKLSHPNLKILFPVKHVTENRGPAVDMKDYELHFRNFLQNPYRPIADTGNQSIAINDIRQLKREASFGSSEKGRRIFILLNIETMRTEAVNSLLKILEEPPENVLFIMTTGNLDLILPTIRSRCQLIRFQPFTREELLALLRHYHPEKEDSLLQSISILAEGNYRNAMDFLSDRLDEDQALVVEFLRDAHKGTPVAINQLIKKLYGEKDRAQIRRFFQLLMLWFRDLILIDNSENWRERILFKSQREALVKFLNFYRGLDLNLAVDIVDDGIQHLESNGYPPLVITNLTIRLHEMLRAQTRKKRSA